MAHPNAVARLTGGSDTVKQETEAAIALYAEQHRSSIAQNAARAAAGAAGSRHALPFSAANASAASATARPAPRALASIAAALQYEQTRPAVAEGAPTGPLAALKALRDSLAQVKSRRSAPQPTSAPALPPLPVICPHVALPVLPLQLPQVVYGLARPPGGGGATKQTLRRRAGLWRASGVVPSAFWRMELGAPPVDSGVGAAALPPAT